MQIEVNRKDFISALNVGGSMAGRVKTIPILEDVKITIKGTSAVISSFDNETAITKRTCIVSSTEDAMFCINPRNLVNILKTIKDENVSLYVVENVCTIVHSKGEATLPVEPAIDFPPPAKEAIEMWWCTRLAAVIKDLEDRDGLEIDRVRIYEDGTNYTMYWLKKEDE